MNQVCGQGQSEGSPGDALVRGCALVLCFHCKAVITIEFIEYQTNQRASVG